MQTGPKTERLTILRAATHETELGDHDFCLSLSAIQISATHPALITSHHVQQFPLPLLTCCDHWRQSGHPARPALTAAQCHGPGGSTATRSSCLGGMWEGRHQTCLRKTADPRRLTHHPGQSFADHQSVEGGAADVVCKSKDKF